MRRAWSFTSGTLVSFYRDQGTHHAAALTYYALMSLFPMLLLAVALLGLVGEFPATYNSIVHYLSGVVPATTLAPLNAAVRAALKSKGTALAALGISILAALYGATGYLEAARRALNVVLDSPPTRSFVQRKLTDILSTLVLLELVLVTLTLMFAGATVAREILGSEAAAVWRIGRWPAALVSALMVFLVSLCRDAGPHRASVALERSRRRRGGGRVGVGLRRVLGLPGQFLELQRHLWLIRRRDYPARLAVADQRRPVARGRSQRRALAPKARAEESVTVSWYRQRSRRVLFGARRAPARSL